MLPVSTDETSRPARLAYTIDAFAEALGVSRGKVFKEIRQGHLEARKCGRRTLIPAAVADRYLANLPNVARAA
jgi:excisionase family DNA binding protein